MRTRASHSIRRKRCFALVAVLSLLAISTVLVTALFSLSRTEHKSSRNFQATLEANQLSEVAKNVVISQIRKATQIDPKEGISWSSQPGALRTYSKGTGRKRGTGTFHKGYKLYSDSILETARERHLATDAPPDDWNQQPERYVDINEPVLRSDVSGVETHFPIFDPRAAHDDPNTFQVESVEGFSIDPSLPGVDIDNDEPDNWRLPMPVEWLYVLRDGTIGFLDKNNTFKPSNKVTKENPIEGRIAFWADDESCKININTASEPTYWATPHLGDRADWGWAKIQPASGEFQRFPGHPATTALSPVLFPNQKFAEPAVPDKRGKMLFSDIALSRESAAEKGKIYQWAPKIQDIGSRSGTEFMWRERGGPQNRFKFRFYPEEYDPTEAANERLFASVDEFLLDPTRQEHDFNFTYHEGEIGGQPSMNGESHSWVNSRIMNRSRAFLTQNSRAPETTLFGTPRIAMWPLHLNGNESDGYRTHFDHLIARCTTLGKISDSNNSSDNSYYFRRLDSKSPNTDLNIQRNKTLLNYLRRLTSEEIPGFGGNFGTKYRGERDQILVQMFDYIRSTNTLDPLIASRDREETGREIEFKTYTAGKRRRRLGQEFVADWREGIWTFQPGHGHVTPSYHEEWNARGFGRALTLDEVAMMFICCADGTPNEHNIFRNTRGIDSKWRGGAAGVQYWAIKNLDDPYGFDTTRKHKFVFSNFPPNPEGEPYGPRNRLFKNGTEESIHPGYMRENWNFCLADNTPLDPGVKRIQGMLLLDWFCPSPGFNPLVARYGARVKGLKNLTVNGEALFPDDEVTIWGDASADPSAHKSPGIFYRNKLVAGRDPMPADKAEKHRWLEGRDNELITNFIDVTGDRMDFGASGPITIEVLAQQDKDDSIEELQTIVIRFPDPAPIPTPNLVVKGRTGRLHYNPNREPPGIPDPQPPSGWGEVKGRDGTTWGDDDWGRWAGFDPQPFYFWSFYRSGYNQSYRFGGRMNRPHHGASNPGFGNYIHHQANTDVVFSMMPWHGDHRIVAAQRKVDKDPNSPYQGRVFAPVPGVADANENNFGEYFLDHKLRHRNNGIRKALNRNPRISYQLAGLPWEARSWAAPHFPYGERTDALSRRFGDFDLGIGSIQGGPFINKPDEGNLAATTRGTDGTGELSLTKDKWGNWVVGKGINVIPYFASLGSLVESLDGSFSPNRMIPSPVVMGSLPTGVKAQDPWRTLLFRPHLTSSQSTGQNNRHPGTGTPPDHLLLDLFWMPVVEPYAISEPFSTAGKVNLNYQILPFKHIRRSTAMHGLLKSELITAIPVADDPRRDWTFTRVVSRSAAGNVPTREYVHRAIDTEETLEAFDKKFEEDLTLFRSASQICEMHLVPVVEDTPRRIDEGAFPNKEADTDLRMQDFWKTNRGTSDNLRERPYANLYSRVTTQTNTWRIHYRVQTINKARSSKPDTFDPELDSIAAEQRGSSLIERYINPNDPDLPDFAEDPDASLESEYQYREVSTRRFSP